MTHTPHKLLVKTLLLPLLFLSCHGSLPAKWDQQAYLWQREWTPQVLEGINTFQPQLDGLQILAAEISWPNGKPSVFRTQYDIKSLTDLSIPLTFVMRIGPTRANSPLRN